MPPMVRAPARRAGDSDSNPGPGEKFSLKLLKDQTLRNITVLLSY